MKILTSNLGRLRFIAFLEGLSFILLLGIAVPLKYIYGYQHATQEIGMIHGLLFISYVILIYPVQSDLNWSKTQTFWAMLASVLPFGTFIAEYRLFRRK